MRGTFNTPVKVRKNSDCVDSGSETVLATSLLQKMLSELRSDIIYAQKQSEKELGNSIEFCNNRIDGLHKLLSKHNEIIKIQQIELDSLREANTDLKNTVSILSFRCDEYSRSNAVEI